MTEKYYHCQNCNAVVSEKNDCHPDHKKVPVPQFVRVREEIGMTNTDYRKLELWDEITTVLKFARRIIGSETENEEAVKIIDDTIAKAAALEQEKNP